MAKKAETCRCGQGSITHPQMDAFFLFSVNDMNYVHMASIVFHAVAQYLINCDVTGSIQEE